MLFTAKKHPSRPKPTTPNREFPTPVVGKLNRILFGLRLAWCLLWPHFTMLLTAKQHPSRPKPTTPNHEFPTPVVGKLNRILLACSLRGACFAARFTMLLAAKSIRLEAET